MATPLCSRDLKNSMAALPMIVVSLTKANASDPFFGIILKFYTLWNAIMLECIMRLLPISLIYMLNDMSTMFYKCERCHTTKIGHTWVLFLLV